MAMTAEERAAEDAVWEAGLSGRTALAQIKKLEAEISPRRIREMATPEGQQWMLDLEAQIAVERAKL